jgi:hypothetical protein
VHDHERAHSEDAAIAMPTTVLPNPQRACDRSALSAAASVTSSVGIHSRDLRRRIPSNRMSASSGSGLRSCGDGPERTTWQRERTAVYCSRGEGG